VANQDKPSPSHHILRASVSCTLATILFVLTAVLLTPHAATAASRDCPHVLLLYSDEKDLPMNVIIDGQRRPSFSEKLGDGARLISEYLDVNRFAEGRFQLKQLDFQTDPRRRDCIPFHEYFHGDIGSGVGASHQTGWTALIASLLFEYGGQHGSTGAESLLPDHQEFKLAQQELATSSKGPP
jgi:hypothetical protein